MINPNYKNLAENLIIIIVVGLLSGAVGYQAARKANKDTIAQLTPTINQAIDKETIKNEIKNEIQIDKIKKSDSLRIILDPTNNQEPVNNMSKDSNCIALSQLSNREVRRLKRNKVIN